MDLGGTLVGVAAGGVDDAVAEVVLDEADADGLEGLGDGGDLREDVDALDCLVATFPAGTLSGAPKPRAIRLIDEMEPAARGVYGGVVGYFDLSGDADLAIAIRTASLRNGVASVQAGAGLVADSVPAREYQETRDKAAAALSSVRRAAVLSPVATDSDDGIDSGAPRVHD